MTQNSYARLYVPNRDRITLTRKQKDDMAILQTKGGHSYYEALLIVTRPKKKIRPPRLHELEARQ